MQSRKRTLQDSVDKAYELARPRALRIGPRQQEFAIVPKSVRYNMYLLQWGVRKAFQIDGRDASYVKEDFAETKRDLYHFVMVHCRLHDLVCFDYPYGLLFTSVRAIRDVLPTFSVRTLPRDILAHAGTLLGIPCSLVRKEKHWRHSPQQIAIVVDGEDVKQYMCTNDGFDKSFAAAIAEYQTFRMHVDKFNTVYTDEPILNISLEFRGKTMANVQEFQKYAFEYAALTYADVRMYTKDDTRSPEEKSAKRTLHATKSL